MSTENKQTQDRQSQEGTQAGTQTGTQTGTQEAAHDTRPSDAIDGLKDKKPEELTPEELRLMADTMPGEGPGD